MYIYPFLELTNFWNSAVSKLRSLAQNKPEVVDNHEKDVSDNPDTSKVETTLSDSAVVEIKCEVYEYPMEETPQIEVSTYIHLC